MAAHETLLIAKDDDDIRDFPPVQQIRLDLDSQRSHADRDFDHARTCAYGAGGQAVIATAAAMADTPVWRRGAIASTIFAGVAVGHFAEGIRHVAASVPPDSVLREAVAPLEAEQPGTYVVHGFRVRFRHSPGILSLEGLRVNRWRGRSVITSPP